MTQRRFISLALLSLLVFLADAAPADTVVTQWSLVTGVNDFSTSPSTEDAVGSFEVTNPFIETHDTFLPPAEFAITNFDFAWDEAADTGSFEIAFDQGITLDSHRTSASGNIFLTSTVPLLLDVNALMNFTSIPSDEADFSLSLTVRDIDTFEVFFGGFEVGGGAHFGEPASGTLAFADADLLIPAGANLNVSYSFRALSPFPPPPFSGPMFNDGFINWSFTPVPEPTTAALICLALPIVLRRRRKRR